MERNHLTVAKIKKAKTTGKDYILWDDEPKGLGVKVSKAGRKTYIVSYRVRRRLRQFTIGAADKWTLDQARKEARRLFVGISKGDDPLDLKKKDLATGTVEEMVGSWCDGYMVRNTGQGNIDNITSMKNKYWGGSTILPRQHRVHRMHLADVRKSHLIDLHEYITDSLGYPSVADRMVKTILQAWRWSIEDVDLDIPPPPCWKFDRLNARTRREVVLSAQDFGAFYQSVMTRMTYGTLSFASGYLMLWLMFTGMRKGEGMALRWTDIDYESRVVHTKDKVLKTKTVFLCDTLIELLHRVTMEHQIRKLKTPYVFPSPYGDRQKPLTAINAQFDSFAIQIGRPELTPHDLRRSFIAAGREDIDWSEGLISKAIQHQSKTTTQRFYGSQRDDRERAVYGLIVGQIADMAGFWDNHSPRNDGGNVVRLFG